MTPGSWTSRRTFVCLAIVLLLGGLVLWRRQRAGRAAPLPVQEKRTDPTRAELYQRARELDIKGRSKMNKEQLRRAVGEREARDR